ncbi:GNAT family N-acetyltransferase [Haloplasma contractile]|uniref:Diamine N-acetyltransferase protein n=1 Tax=Haloplasma contractile SSD-17B TaxID=1033810 RepID=U2FDN5_9MOLU|nr:GNAT family N-acetyltransferase [Haloplasma contractile]ERJ11090.1 diamine N-acetyltransferase protein [Haloplasma contractile SSD-17B]
MVRIEKLHEQNVKDCLHLKVTEDQDSFVSSFTESLAKAFIYYNQVTPFVIYNGTRVVGFILIRFNPDQNNYFIWQFLIDQHDQGKGYGEKALLQTIDWIRMDPRNQEIVTTYKIGNEKAVNLFNKFGFEQFEKIEDEVNVKLSL